MPDTKIETDPVAVAGTHGAFLAMIEIGLGSLLHAFHVPFGGFFLSLNQGFVLGRVVRNFRGHAFVRSLPLGVSNITALLKSLSPAGNRLGPMIAISMQGLFFNAGILVFGANLAGTILGMTLLCLWSYVQIALYFYIIFGKKLMDVLEFHFHEIQAVVPLAPEHILWAVVFFIFLKMFLGVLLGLAAFSLPETTFQLYQNRLMSAFRPRPLPGGPEGLVPAFRGSLKAFFSPLFFITFFLMALFFVLSGSVWQEALFYLIRPLAAGFLLFFTVRILPVHKIRPWLEATRFRNLSRALALALAIIQTSQAGTSTPPRQTPPT